MTTTPCKNIQNQNQAGQSRPVTDDLILKVSKEIVVKFIEVGRLSPGNFGDTFRDIHNSVRDTVRS
jgi:hypothetical protein